MRDRTTGIIRRAAIGAILAGLIVAFANPAPRIARAATNDEIALDKAAHQVAGLVDRAARPLSAVAAGADALRTT
ncbi:hypothetical protein ACFO8O_13955 [Hephaestia sp. GCM10023244]|uniref:hypothetical protein n=1 Tax=unclassified Hephaestia TaxID=2631281 RepID=UPI002076E64A|nr:hypothetical protein [Hephaestia sp. MAHUQ-44]MCM8732066.1 hypothetical protein [Hephaestia sp. MAHUQ-44]